MNSDPRQPDDVRILDNLEALKVYFDPFRQKIVQELASDARTIHEVAESLHVPFTRLYYQFNLLEQHKIIRAVEVRVGSGAIEEKLYRITARQFVISRQFLNADSGEIPEGIHTILDTVLNDTRHEIEKSIQTGLIDMNRHSPDPQALMARRGVMRLSPEQARQFHEELMALAGRYVGISTQVDDDYYGFALVLYPTRLDTDDETLTDT